MDSSSPRPERPRRPCPGSARLQAAEGIPAGLAALLRLDSLRCPVRAHGRRPTRGMLKPGTYSCGTAFRPWNKSSAAALSALIDAIEEAGHGVVMTSGREASAKRHRPSAIAIELGAPRPSHSMHHRSGGPPRGDGNPGLTDFRSAASTRPLPKRRDRSRGPGLLFAASGLRRIAVRRGSAVSPAPKRSPCSKASARTVAEGQESLVVLDIGAYRAHLLLRMRPSEVITATSRAPAQVFLKA